MKKRTLAWMGIAILAIVSIGGFAWTFFGVHEVTMTESELQEMIDAKMPYITEDGITVSNVKLDLSDDKIGISVDVEGEKFNTTFAAGGSTEGALRYNNHKGWFYFHPSDIQFEKLEVGGSTVGDKVGQLIDKWVDSKKVADNKDELMERANQLAEGAAQKTAEFVLARVPVYKLNDDLKGNVVRVLLSDVEVKDKTIIAHLSLWQLTKMVFAYIIAFLAAIGLTVAMFRNPEFGMALLLFGGLGDG